MPCATLAESDLSYAIQFLMTSGKSGDWDKWAGLWGSLITNVLALPATSAGSSIIDYIIVDVMNEPECSDGDKGNYNIDLKYTPLSAC
jgi:hypothetical protein